MKDIFHNHPRRCAGEWEFYRHTVVGRDSYENIRLPKDGTTVIDLINIETCNKFLVNDNELAWLLLHPEMNYLGDPYYMMLWQINSVKRKDGVVLRRGDKVRWRYPSGFSGTMKIYRFYFSMVSREILCDHIENVTMHLNVNKVNILNT